MRGYGLGCGCGSGGVIVGVIVSGEGSVGMGVGVWAWKSLGLFLSRNSLPVCLSVGPSIRPTIRLPVPLCCGVVLLCPFQAFA